MQQKPTRLQPQLRKKSRPNFFSPHFRKPQGKFEGSLGEREKALTPDSRKEIPNSTLYNIGQEQVAVNFEHYVSANIRDQKT